MIECEAKGVGLSISEWLLWATIISYEIDLMYAAVSDV